MAKNHEAEIRELLATYERSLNTGDADLAASCYTDDGVFMHTTLPTITGADMAERSPGPTWPTGTPVSSIVRLASETTVASSGPPRQSTGTGAASAIRRRTELVGATRGVSRRMGVGNTNTVTSHG